MQNTAHCQNLNEKKCQSLPQLMKEQRDATKHIQNFNNSQWFHRYFGFLTTSQPSSAICSWCFPAIPCAVLITASLHPVPAEICSHNKDILFQSFPPCSWPECLSILHCVSANNKNNNNNNTKGRYHKSSQLMIGLQDAPFSWFWEERGFC